MASASQSVAEAEGELRDGHIKTMDPSFSRQGETGLDREGMMLVALMSGGDYIPEGVSGCGIKVACEAAKAGFGKRLCQIKRSDRDALVRWREDLTRELRTNESKFFRTRHKALTIPDEFPNMEVLRYYTHPVVSQAEAVERLKSDLPSRREVDIAGLRAFAAETFDWVYKIGAVKFIRVLAPGLLNQALIDLSEKQLGPDDADVRERFEAKLVKSINIRRTHFSTGGIPELRISYIPNDVVGLDLDAEADEVTSTYGRSGLALNSDDEADEQVENAEAGPRKIFHPLQRYLVWVPETVAKLGVPLAVEDWEEKQRAKQLARSTRKVPAKKPRKKASDMPTGALDRYVKHTKVMAQSQEQPGIQTLLLSSSPPLRPKQHLMCPTESFATAVEQEEGTKSRELKDKPSKTCKTMKEKRDTAELLSDTNHWTITSSQGTPKASRTRMAASEAILISSSPVESRRSTKIISSEPHSATGSARPPPSPTSSFLTNTQSFQQKDNLFNAGRSPATFTATVEVNQGPRKHHLPSDESPRNPAAKRTQRITVSSKPRPEKPPWGPARQGGAHQPTAAQPSIKSFGRLSDTMGRSNVMPAAKRPSPPARHDPDSDDEFQERHAVCTKRKAAAAAETY